MRAHGVDPGHQADGAMHRAVPDAFLHVPLGVAVCCVAHAATAFPTETTVIIIPNSILFGQRI